MRAFVAIALPDQVRAMIADLQAGLRPGRKVPEENLHLTLAFLDDQPQAALQRVHEALSEIATDPFDLRLGGLEMFGGKRPRVLYLRAEASAPLVDLRKQVVYAARQAGIDLPRERFRPHVTLARFRRDIPEDQNAQIGQFLADYGTASLPAFDVRGITLFGSTLHPDGAMHDVLAEYPLGEMI